MRYQSHKRLCYAFLIEMCLIYELAGYTTKYSAIQQNKNTRLVDDFSNENNEKIMKKNFRNVQFDLRD